MPPRLLVALALLAAGLWAARNALRAPPTGNPTALAARV